MNEISAHLKELLEQNIRAIVLVTMVDNQINFKYESDRSLYEVLYMINFVQRKLEAQLVNSESVIGGPKIGLV